MLDRVPPHDLDAEAAVLSSILLDANCFDDVYAVGLTPRSFYAAANARIFEAVCDLRNNTGQPVDIVSVANWLRARGHLEKVGGATYLAQIVDATPAVAHVENHAQLIIDKFRVRSIIAEAHAISAEGYAGPTDVRQFVQSAEARLYAAAGQAPGASTSETAQKVMATCVEQISKRSRGEAPSGHSTGFPTLDLRIGGLRPARLYIAAGRPGSGKTSWVTQAIKSVCTSTALPDKRGVFFASVEMPRDQIGDRLISQECKLDTRKVELGMLTRAEWQQVAEAASRIGQWPLVIDDQPAISISMLRSSVRRNVRVLEREYGTGLGLIAVDYLQIMGDGDMPTNISDNSRLERITGALASMSKEFGVPVIALSQLNRECEKRPDKRPIMSDLRSSGAIEQDAHTIMFFYRDDIYKPPGSVMDHEGEIIVRKCRGGRLGTVRCGYLAFCTLWGDALDTDETDELATFNREMDDLGSFVADNVGPDLYQ